MIEYLPWSNSVLDDIISSYNKGILSILDIQLGGACNFCCIYCDTPDRKKASSIDFEWVEKVVSTNGIKWLFICGLGEPTHPSNRVQLKSILSICKQNSIKCSMFTNLSFIDHDIEQYIQEGTLNILFKLDTLNSEDTAKELFGIDNLATYFENIHGIHRLVKVENGCTNIAASIVPTQLNKNELLDLVDFCLTRNIFPLIGDLEDSGSSSAIYNKLKIPDQELNIIKSEIENILKIDYQIPICPSVIGGIHINYKGDVIVDEETGLSCHWFWLKEPKIKQLVECSNKFELETISKALIEYRTQNVLNVENHINTLNPLPFGGCGGDIKSLLVKYINSHKQLINKDI